jgi:hypothetical protein
VRSGVALEFKGVANAAEEVRGQVLPAPEWRHGGGGFYLEMVRAQLKGNGQEQENGMRRLERWDGGAAAGGSCGGGDD